MKFNLTIPRSLARGLPYKGGDRTVRMRLAVDTRAPYGVCRARQTATRTAVTPFDLG